MIYIDININIREKNCKLKQYDNQIQRRTVFVNIIKIQTNPNRQKLPKQVCIQLMIIFELAIYDQTMF